MKISRFFLMLLTLPALLNSGYLEYVNSGRQIYPCMTSTASRGYAGITSDPLVNPANTMPARYSFTVNTGLKYTTESEVVSVFDSYNNRIGRLTIAQNSGINLTPYSALIYFNFQKFGTGIFAVQSADFNYEYKYVERNAFYQIVSEISKSSSGNGNIFGIMANYSGKAFSAGAEVDYLSLNYDKKYEHIFFETGRTDTIVEEKFDENAFVFKGGLKASHRNYSAGFVFSTSDKETNTPLKTGLGISVGNTGFIPSRIHFDFRRNFYGQLNDSLRDVNSFYFGLENKFYNRTVFSLGGGYEENCFEKQAGVFFFTAGFLTDFEPIAFSMSFQYDQRDYPKPGDAVLTVRESSVGMTCGITYLL
ncbi:hypothetical protein JXL83_07960 [candidate division WOR-3 bacterium]|nr:hypothetical protein [candidate division WOR-3 bacterium]